ncbi:hypothetical protein DPMN_003870 [Dreissena polymorpha]|uniref:Uncharacterized protein n=1 Tax=Dreissena polymorpha TaxID=45954 RepID=A0A9D4RT17_DREPO|nr:hypothetical protein DPMN_003870 [Dreissena polymorpha]
MNNSFYQGTLFVFLNSSQYPVLILDTADLTLQVLDCHTSGNVSVCYYSCKLTSLPTVPIRHLLQNVTFFSSEVWSCGDRCGGSS